MKETFVSRAGDKVEFGLKHFGIDLKDLICADFGSSKGGFVDCLLQHDAKKVFAVDTSYGEFDYKLRIDPRVVLFERTNAMYVTLPEQVDFISIDVSWTKQEHILPNALANLKPKGKIISLIKPSFETDSKTRYKLASDSSLYMPIVESVVEKLKSLTGILVSEPIESPILGEKGKNKEFLVFITKI